MKVASARGSRLHCAAPLVESAAILLHTRLDELEEVRASIAGPADSEALHQLRIAAKRLRYSLEMFTICFRPALAQEWADGVRAMQDVLGRIHDLDVMHILLQEHIERIDAYSREQAMSIAMLPADGAHREDELRERTNGDGKADGRFGLYKVIAAKADERRHQYDRFVELWSGWEENGFLTTIRGSLPTEYPPVDAPAKRV